MEATISSAKQKLYRDVVCPVELSLRVLGGKWRGSILYQLRDRPLRFNQLKYFVQDSVVSYDDEDHFLSNKVLNHHLKELMEFELVEKTTRGLNGDSVTLYGLTSEGKSAIPLLLDLFDWGEQHLR